MYTVYSVHCTLYTRIASGGGFSIVYTVYSVHCTLYTRIASVGGFSIVYIVHRTRVLHLLEVLV